MSAKIRSRSTLQPQQCGSSLQQDRHRAMAGLKEQLPNTASSPTQDVQHSVSLTPTLPKNSAVTHVSENAISEHKAIAPDEADCTARSPSSRSAEPSPERIIISEEDSNETQEDIKPFGNCVEVELHKEKNKDPSLPMVRPPEIAPSIFMKIGSMEQGGIFGLTEIPGSTCNLWLSLVDLCQIPILRLNDCSAQHYKPLLLT
ncbi:uncharacterized protein LOC121275511 [Carcharodon carcharias]|uniref:uncharacterized protein LOC121275511 n=1 Tax=Carcharodon carcharias TaxID=13397 RepID=UPI001B7DBF0B|nr:uncharacterized protein LOC121275511 [Carcharodon carcharias]